MGEHIRFERMPAEFSTAVSTPPPPLIGLLTIDRPAKKNAMTFAVLVDFIEAVREASRDRKSVV